MGIAEREEKCRKIFNLPDSVIPFALFPVAHPESHPGSEDRFDETLIHRNSW
jgi:hypothetical protein